jgi:hypothetical protein
VFLVQVLKLAAKIDNDSQTYLNQQATTAPCASRGSVRRRVASFSRHTRKLFCQFFETVLKSGSRKCARPERCSRLQSPRTPFLDRFASRS